jgi:predicted nucleotide-binding protein (sugar kinase/HSP70/actin superfamily)
MTLEKNPAAPSGFVPLSGAATEGRPYTSTNTTLHLRSEEAATEGRPTMSTSTVVHLRSEESATEGRPYGAASASQPAKADVFDLDGLDIDAELARFEAEERARLGLSDNRAQYQEQRFHDPRSAKKAHTTILLSGLTMAQDMLVSGALAGTGYRVVSLDCPDNQSLRIGKEFGNRGQCNPTYFTVGNLVKSLQEIREKEGISTKEVIDNYVFLTAGSCGPCRFGMYVTEYRKALRDAGFEGFRVLLFQMAGGIKQASGDVKDGLVMGPAFFWAIAKALLIGDVLNGIAYRLRPFEIEPGATDKALEEAKATLYRAFADDTNLVVAMWKARQLFGRVKVDRLRPKPKVGIIGEFWAMTTEGDGNYHMQRFLQEEGAEVDVQFIANWILFMVWEADRDTRHRLTLGKDDKARKGLDGKDPRKKLIMTWLGDKALRVLFQSFAQMIGMHGFKLPDMNEIANIAKDFYNHDVRGGEAHMEVAKNILNVIHQKVNMTLSVKPFGCMPSSGVSDGVQSAITELYPEAIFLPIETTGDGAVNVYSRVQMMLFKAKKAAKNELDKVYEAYGMTEEQAKRTLDRLPFLKYPLIQPPHRHASTAANMAELVGMIRNPRVGLKRWWEHRQDKPEVRLARHLASRHQTPTPTT